MFSWLKMFYFILLIYCVFETNPIVGQFHLDHCSSHKCYVSNFTGGKLFVFEDTISFSVKKHRSHENSPEAFLNWRMIFQNSSQHFKYIENSTSPPNYIVDYDGKPHQSSNIGSITIQNLWNNIDMELMINETSGNFKYQFILHPGANPDDIQWEYEGVDKIEINEFGEIEILIGDQVFRDTSPKSYSLKDSLSVQSKFVRKGNIIGFDVNTWDRKSALIIDPELIIGSFVGSVLNNDHLGYLAGYDEAGNIYGASTSSDFEFPAEVGIIENYNPGSNIIAISKFNAENQNLEWVSQLGGSEIDIPLQIISDGEGGVFVLIISSSEDFPETHVTGSIPDDEFGYFLVKINQFGELVKSIKIGATRSLSHLTIFDGFSFGSQYKGFVQLNPESRIVTFGLTSNSDGLPTSLSAFQPEYLLPIESVFFKGAYVGKLNIDSNTLLNATYLSTIDTGLKVTSMKSLSNGNIALGSRIRGVGDFNIANNAYQSEATANKSAFISIFSEDLSEILFSTYLGSGNSENIIQGIDETSSGEIVVNLLTDTIQSFNNTGYSILDSHNHILGFDSGLSQVLFHGSFGGTGADCSVYTTAFLVDKCDKIYVSGNANFNLYTSNMNLTPDAFTNQGGFYMASFEPEMADISFATLLGGNHTDGGISTYDEKGVVYQGVCSVLGDPFLTTDNAWDDTQMGGVELGVYKIDFQSEASVSQFTTQFNNLCAPVELQLNNHSTLGEYQWFLDDELFSSETQPTTLINDPGEHLLQLVTYNENSCNVYDTLSVLINVPEPSTLIADWETTLLEDCDETSFSASFTGSSADNLTWTFDGLATSGNDFEMSSITPGEYSVQLTATDSLCMVDELLSFEWDYQPGSFEVNLSATDSCLLPFEANLELVSQGLDSFEWVSPDGTSFENNLNFLSTDPGSYTVLLNISDEDCLGDVQTPFVFEVLGSVEAITNTNQIIACAPDDFLVQGSSNLGDGIWIINGQTFDQDVVSGSWEESFSGTWSYIATNAATCNVSDTVLVEVVVSQAPSGVFSWSSPSTPCQEEWILELEFTGDHVDEVIWEVNEELYFGFNHSIFYSSFEEIEVNASASNSICPNLLTEQFSLVSLVGEESTLLVPNVITPNGDGLNDVLLFPADQLKGDTYSLQITNRWGQEVFESTNAKTPWRGDVEDGVYFYILKAQLLCEDAAKTYTGVVHVLR